MASWGFTHGPPVSLQPGELKMAISRPSRSASAAAWRTASNHSGVPKGILVSTVWPPPAFTSANMKPPMPTRFIHSRSLVIPSLVTLLIVQCHQVRGFAASGGVLNPAASESPPGCAYEETGAQTSSAAKSAGTVARVMSARTRFMIASRGSPRPGEQDLGGVERTNRK